MATIITPLCVGWIEIDRSLLTYGRGFGERLRVPLLGYLVKDDSALILVDTGPPPVPWCKEHLRPISQTAPEQLLEALGRCHVRPEDIDLIVLTHLHWDHCGGTDRVPKAAVVAQRAEVAYARAPLPLHVMSYQAPESGLPSLFDFQRIKEIDGDDRLTARIEILHTPGHSPGSQSLLVRCALETYLIAGDTIPLYDNLEPLSEYAAVTPPGIHVDLRDCADSMERIRSMRAKVLPGHDAAVLQWTEYR